MAQWSRIGEIRRMLAASDITAFLGRSNARVSPILNPLWARATPIVSFLRDHGPSPSVFLLILALGIAFGLKYALIEDYLTLGLDPPNYLATMNAIFGGEPTAQGLLARPPLIAVPMKLFTSIFGILLGIKLLGVLASVAIGVPVYLFARRFTSGYVAVVTSLLFVFSSGYSSMVSWGFLTLIGIFFILMTLHLLLIALEKPSTINIVLAGLSASLLVGFHQVSAAMFVLLVGVFLIAYMALNPTKLRGTLKSMGLVTLGALVLSQLYLPSYLFATSEASSGASTASLMSLNSFQEGKTILSFFFPDTALVILLLIAATAGTVLLWQRNRNACLLLAVLFFVPLSAAFVTIDLPGASPVVRRFPYLMYAPLWIFAGVALSSLLSRDDLPLQSLISKLPGAGFATMALASAAIAVFFILEIPASQGRLEGALNFYKYLDEPVWEGVNWIKENTEPDDLIIAHPTNFGWWIEGAGRRNAYETRGSASFYESQRDESLIADLSLSRNQGLGNGNMRFAVSYPYNVGPGGSQAVDVFAGGQYQQVLLMHDYDQQFEVQVGGRTSNARLSANLTKDQTVRAEGDGITMDTTYQMEGFRVLRSMKLKPGEAGGTMSYTIAKGERDVTKFTVDLNLHIGQGLIWEMTGPNSFQKTQSIRTFSGREPIVTDVVIDVQGATLELVESEQFPNHLLAIFELQAPESTLTFRLDAVSPISPTNQPVTHFSVPGLLAENSIAYIVVDEKTASPLFSGLDWRTSSWLNESPYLEVAFEQEDVKIYKVNLPQPTGFQGTDSG